MRSEYLFTLSHWNSPFRHLTPPWLRSPLKTAIDTKCPAKNKLHGRKSAAEKLTASLLSGLPRIAFRFSSFRVQVPVHYTACDRQSNVWALFERRHQLRDQVGLLVRRNGSRRRKVIDDADAKSSHLDAGVKWCHGEMFHSTSNIHVSKTGKLVCGARTQPFDGLFDP